MKSVLKNIYDNLTLSPAATAEEEAKNISKFIFSSQPFYFRNFSKRLRKALFRTRDPELLHAVQKEFQWVSLLATQDTEETQLAQILVWRILALYPFLEPAGTIDVPLYRDRKWKIVSYSVERWELSPHFLGSPLTAFALTASGQPSLFLFMGTAFPTMSGHILSLWTDFVPGLAVGELAFRLFAKKRFSAWLESQSVPVVLIGQSLGAALALQAACAFDKKISQVHAFCPPALYTRTLSQYSGHARVNLYWHKNDIVPLVGSGFHQLWKMYYIQSDVSQPSFFAHTRAVPALSPLSIEERMPPRRSWPFVTAAHFLLSLPIFCLTTIILFINRCLCYFTRQA